MARRRDATSRRTTREDRFVSRVNRESYQTRLYTTSVNDSTGRMRGRRGVRARAREARIEARIANGTYRQPGGGTTTNS